ncbi:MAG: hypothetical protein U1E14_10815 [Geminicoccaceae bacterium]
MFAVAAEQSLLGDVGEAEPRRAAERGNASQMTQSGPLLLIGLDALEARELAPRLGDGRMPNLARLLGNKPLRSVDPDIPGFPDGLWRSFVNGAPVGEHGWFFRKQWRPENGRVEPSSRSWLRLEPFWKQLAAKGARIAILDVPQAPDPGPEFPGLYLNGWQTHDPEETTARPASLLAELEARVGKPRLPKEVYGPQRAVDMLALRRAAMDSIEQFAEIIVWLLQRERFDLFAAVFGSVHRVGHYLWDLSQLDTAELAVEERVALEGTLDAVYAALDLAVGRVAAAAPAGARLVVFALHGMGPNPGWTELVPQLLRRLPEARIGRSRSGWRAHVDHMRRNTLVMRASQMLPRPVSKALGSAWTSRMHDWSKTRAFAVPAELSGLVRVNLAGRDRQGIVEPGPAYEDLLTSLESSLRSLTVVDDGSPLVASVHQPLRMVPDHARYRSYLPDLVVEWREGASLSTSSGVRLPDGSTLRWERGRRLTSGRSGNHRTSGWLVADADFAGDEPTVIDVAAAVAGHFGLDLQQEPAEAAPGDSRPGRRRVTARRARSQQRPVRARRGRLVLARSPA